MQTQYLPPTYATQGELDAAVQPAVAAGLETLGPEYVETHLPERLSDDSLTAAFARTFKPQQFGNIDPTGATDNSAPILAALQAAHDAGGGTVLLDPHPLFQRTVYRCDAKIALPDHGNGTSGEGAAGTPPTGGPVRLVGPGPVLDATLRGTDLTVSAAVDRGVILDLRYNGADPARIDGRYSGALEITGLTLTNFGTANAKPFLFTTNPVLHIHGNAFVGHADYQHQGCVEDAIVLGAVDSKIIGPGSDAIFQGYGSVIERNVFDGIRRAVWGRSSVNGLLFDANVFSTRCGATADEAAVEFDGGTALSTYPQSGNVVSRNIFEIGDYPRPVRLRNTANNRFRDNGFYDYQSANLIAVYTITGDSAYTFGNVLEDAHYDAGLLVDRKTFEVDAGLEKPAVRYGTSLRNVVLESQLNLVQPRDAAAAESNAVWAVRRSTAEASFPNADVLSVTNEGNLTLRGPGATYGTYNAAGQIVTFMSVDGSAGRLAGGDFGLYAGPNAGACITPLRGQFKNRSVDTVAQLPSAVDVRRGAAIHVLDAGGVPKMAYSDGSVWRDALGAAL